MTLPLASLFAALLAAPAPEPVIALRAARLFDGIGEMRARMTVLVRGGHIAAVGERVDVPAGAEVIDLGDATLLPGLIDAHTHLALHAGDYDRQILRETPELRTIRRFAISVTRPRASRTSRCATRSEKGSSRVLACSRPSGPSPAPVPMR